MDKNAGGWSETKQATEKTQWICDQVKSQVETMTNKKYQDFRAVKYRDCRVENGTNFLIKVRVGEPRYIHLLVFQIPRRRPELRGVQEDKTKDDNLEPFNN